MICINCVNPGCTAPDKKFKWDERPKLKAEGRLAEEGDPDAKSFIVPCPYCGIRNKIWLANIKPDLRVTRGL
jgi:hypothetical protein